MSKRQVVINVLDTFPKLLNAPASKIAQAVMEEHGIEVSEVHVSGVRKEYKENMSNNHRAEPLPEPEPVVNPPVAAVQAPVNQPPNAVERFEEAMNLLGKVRALAQEVGGIDNLILLAQKVAEAGF